MSSAPRLDQIARKLEALSRIARRARVDRINWLEDMHGDMTDEAETLLNDPVLAEIDAALDWYSDPEGDQ